MSWAFTGVIIAGAGLAANVAGGLASANAQGKQAEANSQQAIADAKQAHANQEAAEFNAAVLEQNAKFVEEGKDTIRTNYGLERRRLAETKNDLIGASRVAAAASGIDADYGSAGHVQDDTERGYQIDRAVLITGEKNDLRSADVDIYNYKTEALLAKKQGQYYNGAGAAALKASDAAIKAGRTAQLGTILTTAANVASQWIPAAKTTLNFGTHSGGGKS